MTTVLFESYVSVGRFFLFSCARFQVVGVTSSLSPVWSYGFYPRHLASLVAFVCVRLILLAFWGTIVSSRFSPAMSLSLGWLCYHFVPIAPISLSWHNVTPIDAPVDLRLMRLWLIHGSGGQGASCNLSTSPGTWGSPIRVLRPAHCTVLPVVCFEDQAPVLFINWQFRLTTWESGCLFAFLEGPVDALVLSVSRFTSSWSLLLPCFRLCLEGLIATLFLSMLFAFVRRSHEDAEGVSSYSRMILFFSLSCAVWVLTWPRSEIWLSVSPNGRRLRTGRSLMPGMCESPLTQRRGRFVWAAFCIHFPLLTLGNFLIFLTNCCVFGVLCFWCRLSVVCRLQLPVILRL